MLGLKDITILHRDLFNVALKPQYDLVFCHYPFRDFAEDKIIEDINSCIKYSDKRIRRLDWPFMIKALNATSENGKAIIVTINGPLFSQADLEFKREIVEKGYLEAVINMPRGTLQGLVANYSIVVLSNNNQKVKFINAEDAYIGKMRDRHFDVEKIVKLYKSTEDNELVRYFDIKTIFKNCYNLEPSLYFRNDYESELINA